MATVKKVRKKPRECKQTRRKRKPLTKQERFEKLADSIERTIENIENQIGDSEDSLRYDIEDFMYYIVEKIQNENCKLDDLHLSLLSYLDQIRNELELDAGYSDG